VAETSGETQHPNALKREDIVALNTSQFPTSSTQLTDLLRAVLTQNLANSDLGPLRLLAELSSPNIGRLDVDLTDCQIVLTKGEYRPRDEAPPLVAFDTGRIDYYNAQAQPLIIGAAPVNFRIEGRDLPIGWFRLPDDELGVGILEESADTRVPAGKFSAEADPQDLVELVRALAAGSLPDEVEVYRPRASVSQAGPESFIVSASCRVRYKIFRVRLGVEVAGRLASTGLLTIERIWLRRSNWILRMFTRVLRREYEKTHDLNKAFTSGSKLTNLRFSANEKLAVSGELR